MLLFFIIIIKQDNNHYRYEARSYEYINLSYSFSSYKSTYLTPC